MHVVSNGSPRWRTFWFALFTPRIMHFHLARLCMSPAASGRGLCDIDRVIFRVPWTTKITDNLAFSILIIIGKSSESHWKMLSVDMVSFISVYDARFSDALLPNVLKRKLVTLNTLSVSHSPRPLPTGPIHVRNAEKMESLPPMDQRTSRYWKVHLELF